MKRFFALFLAVCLMAVPVAAEENYTTTTVSITLGNTRNSDLTPEITIDDVHVIYVDGIEMAELRKVAEALNYTVVWRGDFKSIDLVNIYGVREFLMTVDSTLCRVAVRADVSPTSYDTIYFSTFVKAVDGVTYVPTEFMKEYLTNYNFKTVSFNEFQLDKDFSLLGRALNIKMPEDTIYEDGYLYSIMSAAASDKEETELRLSLQTGESIYVFASNMFVLTAGDIKKDLENLGGDVKDGAQEYAVNDLVAIDIPFSNNPNDDIQPVKFALVMDADGRLYSVGIYMNRLARKHEEYVDFAEKIFSTLSIGNTEEPEKVWTMGLNLNLPENYEPVLSLGPDFFTMKIIKIITTDHGYRPILGIYEGYHPSAQNSYLDSISVSSIQSIFLGKPLTWYIMEDGSMEALVEYGYSYYHFFTSPLTEEERSEFINIVSNITSDID